MKLFSTLAFVFGSNVLSLSVANSVSRRAYDAEISYILSSVSSNKSSLFKWPF